MKHIAIFLIKTYQRTLGQLHPRVCRFEPTCSHYAIEAIEQHGVLKGSLLTTWRILRCQPLCAGGFDPVPRKDRKEVVA